MFRFALPLCAALFALSYTTPAAAQSCDGWKDRYDRVRESADAYKERYEWAKREMRKCQQSAGSPDVNMRRVARGTAKDANRREVEGTSVQKLALSKAGGGTSGGGAAVSGDLSLKMPTGVSTIQVQLLDVETPPAGTVEYRWLEQLHASQGTFMQVWLGSAQFAEYRSVEQQTCSGKGLRCEALLRQFVLEDVARQ
ncbi:MAG: hypothetical protein AAFV19_10870 [Pseudomonadota bacterium]